MVDRTRVVGLFLGDLALRGETRDAVEDAHSRLAHISLRAFMTMIEPKRAPTYRRNHPKGSNTFSNTQIILLPPQLAPCKPRLPSRRRSHCSSRAAPYRQSRGSRYHPRRRPARDPAPCSIERARSASAAAWTFGSAKALSSASGVVASRISEATCGSVARRQEPP